MSSFVKVNVYILYSNTYFFFFNIFHDLETSFQFLSFHNRTTNIKIKQFFILCICILCLLRTFIGVDMLIYTCFINLYFYFIISFGISIQHFISKKIEKMFLVSLFYAVNTFLFPN